MVESNASILKDIFKCIWLILKAFLGWTLDGLLVAFIIHQFWFWWKKGLFGIFDELCFFLTILAIVLFLVARIRERRMLRGAR